MQRAKKKLAIEFLKHVQSNSGSSSYHLSGGYCHFGWLHGWLVGGKSCLSVLQIDQCLCLVFPRRWFSVAAAAENQHVCKTRR